VDYWFGYSDDSNIGSYDPARECFVIVIDEHADCANGTGDGDAPQEPEPNPPPAPPAGRVSITAQLAQARELEAKLTEEYRQVRLLHATIIGEASAHDQHAREAGRQARQHINTDFNVDDLHTPPRASQKLIAAATLLWAMPEPSTPEAHNLPHEAQALIKQEAVQQAESSASHIHNQSNARGDGDTQDQEASVHTGGTAGQPANQGRTPVKERILDSRDQAHDGDARNVLNAKKRAMRRHEQRRATTLGEVVAMTAGRAAIQCWNPPGTRVFSREIRTVNFPLRFHQPTSITKYTGETDPRVWLNDYRLACQLGGTTTNAVITRNLLLHLVDSARTWLVHLPPSLIHSWDNLVRTQKPDELLWDFIRHFS
jgi:hypothetical protein